MTSALGPTNTIPNRSHSSANSGRSATKPHPTHAASAPPASSARSSGSEVEVRAARTCRAVVVEAHRFVGIADEHGLPLGPRVQGDGAQVVAALDSQFAHRVDQPHRGLAAIDDRDPTKWSMHRA